MSSLHDFSEFWAGESLLLLMAASFSKEMYQAVFIIHETYLTPGCLGAFLHPMMCGTESALQSSYCCQVAWTAAEAAFGVP